MTWEQSCNHKKLDASSKIGLTYTNELPVLSHRYCLCSLRLMKMLLEMLLAVSEMHQKVFQQTKMELYFLYNASMLEIFRNGIYWFVHIDILVCLTASLHCTDIIGQSLQVQIIKRPYFKYLNWIEVICFIICILLLTVCLYRMSKCLRLRFLKW